MSSVTPFARLAMRGAPARAIQELAGHRDLTTTERYMHLCPSTLTAAIRLLESPPGLLTNWRHCGDAVEPGGKGEWLEQVKWLGGRDSNPDTVVQSHVSYRWMTSQCQSRRNHAAGNIDYSRRVRHW